jgi:protein phosphatase
MEATKDAFDLLRYIAAKRLALRKLTVIDATNVQPESRKTLIELAREYYCLPVAIVLDLPERVCQDRNRNRPDRNFGPHVIRNQRSQMKRSLRGLEREGFRRVITLKSEEEIAEATIEREPLWNDLRSEHGPFDIIGDLHGCCDELEELLVTLGYVCSEGDKDETTTYNRLYRHPEGRRAVFLGDLVDRGPRILDTYQLVRNMVKGGSGLCVPGNHDIKLMRKLKGRNVIVRHGLEQTLQEIDALPDSIRERFSMGMADWIDSLVSHYLLDGGDLVVAHAGMKQSMQGRAGAGVREFALYGETTGETDEFGLPVRYNWAAEYRGSARVVYGHTPVPEPSWLNRTVNIDTGCVFGGRLTALRYPELETVSVAARRVYCDPIRPLATAAVDNRTAQQQHDDMLDISDVTGKRIIQTRLAPNITIREDESIAALEIMSRFAVDPRWLIYLPPTMSPTGTSSRNDLLEHPDEAFEYFGGQNVERVVCQEKHMGSRAVAIVCRTAEAARNRFGVQEERIGIVYTRTGRPFFVDPSLEAGLLSQLQRAMTNAGLWDEWNTDWVCLDCELMPWSAKAQELLRGQYAAVGTAARVGLVESIVQLERGAERGLAIEEMLDSYSDRLRMIGDYTAAYRRYCWPVESIKDYRLAPFHILATEGEVHVERNHLWHMETIGRLVAAQKGTSLQATNYRVVDLNDPESRLEGVSWWEDLTGRGGEGMVIKPLDFIAHSSRGLVQPAIKCRGAEYLRIIYGPEYTTPEHLGVLRSRNVSFKRSLAAREFALGIESLERFVRREPLRYVHECVFGVLALESEPVDPRL